MALSDDTATDAGPKWSSDSVAQSDRLVPVKGHGVVRDNDGQAVEFRFGVVKILEAVEWTWWSEPLFGKPAPVEWPFRPIDYTFDRAMNRLRSSLFTMDRAAQLMHECLLLLRDPEKVFRESKHMAEVAPVLRALDDVHLYADLVLHYLYDYANSIAVVLSRLFRDDGPRPADSSFRQHHTSVTNGAGMDPAYSAIMSNYTAWFDKLAGSLDDPVKGLRTLLVHGHGKSPGPSDFRPQFYERAAGLSDIAAGFFEMHDRLLPWLLARVEPIAAEGTQLSIILENDPPFVAYAAPASQPASFNHFLFPDMAPP